MKLCEKVYDMWALIDAVAVQCIFIGIFEKLVAKIMTETFHWFEMIYREISHEWLDQFLQQPILRGATNFYALESRRFLVRVYF